MIGVGRDTDKYAHICPLTLCTSDLSGAGSRQLWDRIASHLQLGSAVQAAVPHDVPAEVLSRRTSPRTSQRIQQSLRSHQSIHAKQTHTSNATAKGELLGYARAALRQWGGGLYRTAEAAWPCPRKPTDPPPLSELVPTRAPPVAAAAKVSGNP